MMLKDFRSYATIPVADLSRAKAWYKDKLNLEPREEHGGGLIYECAEGTTFLLFPTNNAGTAKNTAAGWQVQNIEKLVGELRDRGVVFEEYDEPVKTVNSITTRGGTKAAWFRDSEGNTLGIFQSED